MKIEKFKAGDLAYGRNWLQNEYVEVLQRMDVMTTFPHYIVRTQHGAKYQISQLELSKNKIELKKHGRTRAVATPGQRRYPARLYRQTLHPW